jgi:Spy/CpxP family protein refolding chaperone
MTRKVLALTLIGGLLVLTAVAAVAHSPDRPVRAFRGHGMLAMDEELGLTDEQLEKIKGFRLQTEKKVIPLRAEMKIAELELRDLLDEPTVDRKAVHEKIEAIGRLKIRIRKLQVDRRIDVWSTLAPEQQEKAGRWFLGRHKGPQGRKARSQGFGRGPGRGCFAPPQPEE